MPASPSSKIRLLMVADAGRPTGFEKVLRGVADRLHATGTYDITVRGLGYYPGRTVRQYRYPVKPAVVDEADVANASSALPTWVEEDRPDVLWTVNDLWNVADFAVLKPHALPFVAYVPIDGPNVQWANASAVGAISEVVAYTTFGATEMARAVRDMVTLHRNVAAPERRVEQTEWYSTPHYMGGKVLGRMDRLERYQQPENYNRVPHGLDKALFHPMDRAACRAAWGIPKDAFVVMNVGTNQFRKRLDLTYRAFAKFARTKPEARLVIHAQASGMYQGWNLGQLGRRYEITDKVIYTAQGRPFISDQDMAQLYNCADVQINTGGGEGWGLPAMESAACGVPQVVPEWSATAELWANAALLTPIRDYRIETRFTNAAHCEIDHHYLVMQLEELYEDTALRTLVAEDCQAVAAQQRTWDEVGDAFDTIIQQALQEPPPRAVSTEELCGLQGPIAPDPLAAFDE